MKRWLRQLPRPRQFVIANLLDMLLAPIYVLSILMGQFAAARIDDKSAAASMVRQATGGTGVRRGSAAGLSRDRRSVHTNAARRGRPARRRSVTKPALRATGLWPDRNVPGAEETTVTTRLEYHQHYEAGTAEIHTRADRADRQGRRAQREKS